MYFFIIILYFIVKCQYIFKKLHSSNFLLFYVIFNLIINITNKIIPFCNNPPKAKKDFNFLNTIIYTMFAVIQKVSDSVPQRKADLNLITQSQFKLSLGLKKKL